MADIIDLTEDFESPPQSPSPSSISMDIAEDKPRKHFSGLVPALALALTQFPDLMEIPENRPRKHPVPPKNNAVPSNALAIIPNDEVDISQRPKMCFDTPVRKNLVLAKVSKNNIIPLSPRAIMPPRIAVPRIVANPRMVNNPRLNIHLPLLAQLARNPFFDTVAENEKRVAKKNKAEKKLLMKAIAASYNRDRDAIREKDKASEIDKIVFFHGVAEAEEEAKEIRRINRNIAQAALRAEIELAAKNERNEMRHLMVIGSISSQAKIPGSIDILQLIFSFYH